MLAVKLFKCVWLSSTPLPSEFGFERSFLIERTAERLLADIADPCILILFGWDPASSDKTSVTT